MLSDEELRDLALESEWRPLLAAEEAALDAAIAERAARLRVERMERERGMMVRGCRPLQERESWEAREADDAG